MANVRLVEFETEGFKPRSPLMVFRAWGTEEISHPFRFELQLGFHKDEKPEAADILKKPAKLGIRLPSSSGDGTVTQYIHGVVTQWEFHSIKGDTVHAMAVFESQLARLSLFRKSRMYPKISVDKILQTILKEELAPDLLDFQVSGAPATAEKESITQEGETNLDFIHRLAEHYGIFYHLKLENQDWKKYTFTDNFSVPIEGPADILYWPERSAATEGREEYVTNLVSHDKVIPDQVVLTDYDWRKTSPLEGKYPASAEGKRIVHLPRENFREVSEGNYLAQLRFEGFQSEETTVTGESTVLNLRPGMKISIKNWPHPKLKELRVIRVEHEFQQAYASGGINASYRNWFVANPADKPYRPPRMTPKPVALPTYGFIDIGEEYAGLEKDGQYPVRDPNLLEQTEKGKGTATRLSRRMYPNAGPKGSGDNRPLHHETEVLMIPVGGDRDRPIIAGALFNSKFPNVVSGSNAQQSIRRTVGGNQEIIDDTTGSQWMSWFCPQYNTHIGLGTSHTASPTSAAGISMGTEQGVTIAGGQTVNIAAGTPNAAGSNGQAGEKAGQLAEKMALIGGIVACASALTLEYKAAGLAGWASMAADVTGLAAGIGGKFAHTNMYLSSPTKVAVLGGGEVFLGAGAATDLVAVGSATLMSGMGTLVASLVGVSCIAAARHVECISLAGDVIIEAKFRGDVHIEAKKSVKIHAKTKDFEMHAHKNVGMHGDGDHFQLVAKHNFLLKTTTWKSSLIVDHKAKKLCLTAGDPQTSSILMTDDTITIEADTIILKSKDGNATLALGKQPKDKAKASFYGESKDKMIHFSHDQNAVSSKKDLFLKGPDKIASHTKELDEKDCKAIKRANSEEG